MSPVLNSSKFSNRNFSVSVIVPTFRELLNLPELHSRLSPLKNEFLDLECIIVDDNSSDGTEAWWESLPDEDRLWFRLIVRKDERGLSTAVIRGLQEAKNDVLIVMDADLSHPPEKIPEICDELVLANRDMVIGSRYVKGGKIEEAWSFFRWINSKVATWMARPFTRAKDPMSGFFALRRDSFLKSAPLSPIGYKIGLELIVKADLENVAEVPIYFSDRKKGSSKLNLKEQLNYLRHLRRLANYKFGNWSYFAQFGFVGGIGVFTNLLSLSILDWLGSPLEWAIAISIWISMTGNFVLNRWITFSHARASSILTQYVGFVLSCSLGALVNYFITLSLAREFALLAEFPQIAAVFGILGGMLINFFTNRYWVFRH